MRTPRHGFGCTIGFILPLSILFLSILPQRALAAEEAVSFDALTALAEEEPVRPGDPELTDQEKEDIRFWAEECSLGEETLGAFQCARRTGFDVYGDTPPFTNAACAAPLLAPAGGCLGMVHVVKRLYLQADFVGKGEKPKPFTLLDAFRKVLGMFCVGRAGQASRTVVPGAKNLREACTRWGAFQWLLQRLSALVTFTGRVNGNIIRQTYLPSPDFEDRLTVGAISLRTVGDQPTVLIYSAGRGGVGHATLAYKVLEFEKKILVYVYDPAVDYGQGADLHNKTVLAFDREDGTLGFFHPGYAGVMKDYKKIFAGESFLELYASLVVDVPAGAVDDLVRDLVEKILGRKE